MPDGRHGNPNGDRSRESRMMGNYQVRFGGGPSEKESQDHLAGGLPNYGGSGPAQLALALLADATGKDRLAVSLHQDFKFKFVGRLPREGFEMTAEEIEKWAADAAAKLDLSDWEAEDGG
jgi:hypothetical protein